MSSSRTDRIEVKQGGRVVLPKDVRDHLHVGVGDELLVSLEDGAIRLSTRDEAIRRAQAWVRSFVPDDVSLVDELIAERRAEARRDDEGM